MRTLKLAFSICLMCMLAACAEQPARPLPPPSAAIAAPPAPAPQIAPQIAPLPPPAPPPDGWSRLRASFAMDDCDLNPRVDTWTRRFTRNPARFQALLREALPLLRYVQDAAQRAQMPGEFVLLPLIESGYEPGEPSRNGDPAGMWQIMPQTARAFGLPVTHGYDGRLDPVASTETVMKMLNAFHADLHDWRLVDMAFNTGEYRMLGLMSGRARPAADQPLHLPVGSITNNHLAKLLAVACIIREPARFQVQLPAPDSDRQLALVQLPEAADLAKAAKLAQIPLAKLRELNPGYRGKRMPADAPHHLLLPQQKADDLLAAINARGANMLASADIHDSHAPKHHRTSRHRVLSGESLLSIAKHYHVDADSLRAWNGLASSDDVHPGMLLRLTAPD